MAKALPKQLLEAFQKDKEKFATFMLEQVIDTRLIMAEAKKSDRCQTYMLSEQPKEVMRSFESLIGNVKLYS